MWIFSVCAMLAIVSLNISVFCRTSFLIERPILRRIAMVGLVVGIFIALWFMLAEGTDDFFRHPIMWLILYLVPIGVSLYGSYRIISVERANQPLNQSE